MNRKLTMSINQLLSECLLMRVSVFLFLYKSSGAIFNGRPASFNQFPSHVALFMNEKSGRSDFCGGTLLSPTIVITAAHCLFQDGKPRYNRYHPEFRVLAGFRHLNDKKGIVACPKWFLIHPLHDSDHEANDTFHLGYDYAIIKLENEVVDKEGRKIGYAGLPKQDLNVKVGKKGLIAGTGYIGKNTNSRHLFFTEMTVLPSNVCQLAYQSDTRSGLCVQSTEKKAGICAGDSGSGFIIDKLIIGIVSYDEDKNCGESYPSAVFAKVSSVTNWILQVMDKNEEEIAEEISRSEKAPNQEIFTKLSYYKRRNRPKLESDAETAQKMSYFMKYADGDTVYG